MATASGPQQFVLSERRKKTVAMTLAVIARSVAMTEGQDDSASENSAESQSVELQTYRKVMRATVAFLNESSPSDIKEYFESSESGASAARQRLRLGPRLRLKASEQFCPEDQVFQFHQNYFALRLSSYGEMAIPILLSQPLFS